MDNRAKNVFLFYKKTPEMEEISKTIIQEAKSYGYHIVSNAKDAQIIISIGGDSAFLQAVQKTNFRENCYYVGISTDSLGFYTDFTINESRELFNSLQEEQISIRQAPVLEVIINEETPFYCLNECTIRSNVIKSFVIEVFIDDMHFETFRGDGMIVSTPSGSTGYSKSVRGAVIDPDLPSLQVSEIASLNNNSYRTLGTSFILGPNRKLTLEVVQDGNDHPIIGVDNEALSIRHAKQIHLSLANRQMKVVQKKEHSFWKTVQKTFV